MDILLTRSPDRASEAWLDNCSLVLILDRKVVIGLISSALDYVWDPRVEPRFESMKDTKIGIDRVAVGR